MLWSPEYSSRSGIDSESVSITSRTVYLEEKGISYNETHMVKTRSSICPQGISGQKPGPIGTGKQKKVNAENQRSVTIEQLRNYWHNQLTDQKKPINPSDHTSYMEKRIEPWMIWMPTEDEWDYKIAPVDFRSHNQIQYDGWQRGRHDESNRSSFHVCNNRNLSENVSVYGNKKEARRKIYRYNRRCLRKKKLSLEQARRQGEREEQELLEYKKRFGFYAKSRDNEDLAGKNRNIKVNEKKEQLTSAFKTPPFNQKMARKKLSLGRIQEIGNEKQEALGHCEPLPRNNTYIHNDIYLNQLSSLKNEEYCNNNSLQVDGDEDFLFAKDSVMDPTIPSILHDQPFEPESLVLQNEFTKANAIQDPKDEPESYQEEFRVPQYSGKSNRYTSTKQRQGKKQKTQNIFHLNTMKNEEKMIHHLRPNEYVLGTFLWKGFKVTLLFVLISVTLLSMYSIHAALLQLFKMGDQKKYSQLLLSYKPEKAASQFPVSTPLVISPTTKYLSCPSIYIPTYQVTKNAKNLLTALNPVEISVKTKCRAYPPRNNTTYHITNNTTHQRVDVVNTGVAIFYEEMSELNINIKIKDVMAEAAMSTMVVMDGRPVSSTTYTGELLHIRTDNSCSLYSSEILKTVIQNEEKTIFVCRCNCEQILDNPTSPGHQNNFAQIQHIIITRNVTFFIEYFDNSNISFKQELFTIFEVLEQHVIGKWITLFKLFFHIKLKMLNVNLT